MNQTTNCWMVSVDGSKYSQWGWEVCMEELYKQGDEIFISHISNPEKEQIIPYQSQPKTLYEKYDTICKGKYPPLNYQIIFGTRTKGNAHALEDLYSIAKSKNISCIVMGFQGHKANEEKKELSKGLLYMVKNITMPVLIIKERSVREKKDTKGFNWLVCLNNTRYSRTYFNAFKHMLPQVDLEKDKIMGVTITRSGDGSEKKEVESDFSKKCTESGIKNCSFKYVDYDRSINDIGKQLANLINYNEERIDFISLGFNYKKFENIEDAPALNVIKLVMANILYCPIN